MTARVPREATWGDPLVGWGDRRYSWSGRRLALPPFPLPPETFESVLQRAHTVVSKIEFLSDDMAAVLATLDGKHTNGSCTTDTSSDTFVSASVELVNDDGTMSVDIVRFIWPGRLVRISRGALVNGVPRLEPLITGVIDIPEDGAFTAKVGFTVASRLSLAKRAWPGPTTFPTGTRGRDVMRRGLELGGLGTSDRLYNLQDGGYAVPAPLTFDASEILGDLVKWAFNIGCDLWIDGSGVVQMAPFVDTIAEPHAFDFGAGTNAVLTNAGRKVRLGERVNRVVVQFRGADGYANEVQVKNDSPGDPLRWRSDFDFPYTYPANATMTEDVARSIGYRILADKSSIEEAIDFEAVPVPLVSARKVVGFPGAGYDGGFVLTSCTIPTYRGPMRGHTTRVRSLRPAA